jgi:hypothetical protein
MVLLVRAVLRATSRSSAAKRLARDSGDGIGCVGHRGRDATWKLSRGANVDAIPALAAMHRHQQAFRAVLTSLPIARRQLDNRCASTAGTLQVQIAFEQSDLDLLHMQAGQTNGVQNALGQLCVSLPHPS